MHTKNLLVGVSSGHTEESQNSTLTRMAIHTPVVRTVGQYRQALTQDLGRDY